MTNYQWSICDPATPEVIEKGAIPRENIMEIFERFPWTEHLRKMASMKDDEIHYSPSLEFENTDEGKAVSFSAVGEEYNFEFYIFYKRPKVIKSFLGFSKREEKAYISDITGQTMDGAKKFLQAFLTNDSDYMESCFPD